VVYDAARSRLYALNDASNTVSAWSVNQTTGALTSLPLSVPDLPKHPAAAGPTADRQQNGGATIVAR
jgi:hypothetical protein